MKARLPVFAVAAVLVASVGMAPAYGQIQDPIVVMTDKASYAAGETIFISGEVRDRLGFEIGMQVFDPDKNLVAVDQIEVGVDKKFNVTLTAGGDMKEGATHTLYVQYGDSSSRSAETTFEFTGGEIPAAPDRDPPNSERIEGNLITWDITGGKVVSITAERFMPPEEAGSLIIIIEATEDGEITLTVPKTVLDSVGEPFFVLVDQQEEEFEHTDDGDTHTMSIQFPAGAEEIEIIGTFVIPEFGAIAAVVLAVAIISVIAVTSRSRLGVMPRL